MGDMKSLEPSQLWNFFSVLLVILAIIVLVANAIKALKEWRKPHNDLETWRRDVDQKLNRDNKRLTDLEEGNRVICRGILAMLSHEINGNANDKLLASQQEITDYLIER